MFHQPRGQAYLNVLPEFVAVFYVIVFYWQQDIPIPQDF